MRAGYLMLGMIGLATAAGAARESDADRMAKALKGYQAGKEVDCIRQFPSMQSTNYGDVIVYEQGRTRYLNRFGGNCRIGRDDVMITRSYSSQLCRGDIAQFVDRTAGFPHGACALGSFTTYTKAK